jgi:hypothetical protein
LWHEARLEVNMLKTPHVRATFGRWSVVLCGRHRGFCTLTDGLFEGKPTENFHDFTGQSLGVPKHNLVWSCLLNWANNEWTRAKWIKSPCMNDLCPWKNWSYKLKATRTLGLGKLRVWQGAAMLLSGAAMSSANRILKCPAFLYETVWNYVPW